MSSEKPELHPSTLAAQGMGRVAAPFRDIVPPIHVATTYERGADGAYPGGRVYSRADNPTYDQAEALIAALEGAAAAMLFASGQAAAAALFQALAPGDRILAPRSMYWALRKWLLDYAAPWGLSIAKDDQLWVCGSSPHWWFRHEKYPEYKDQILMRFTTTGRTVQTWTLPLGDIGTNKDMPDTSRLKPGETVGAHCIAQDSKGNVYVGDIYGERAQKFVPVSKR